MSEPSPAAHTHNTGPPPSDTSDWDAMFAPKVHKFTCQVRKKGWSPSGRVPGWNRCPHCKTIYRAEELLGA